MNYGVKKHPIIGKILDSEGLDIIRQSGLIKYRERLRKKFEGPTAIDIPTSTSRGYIN